MIAGSSTTLRTVLKPYSDYNESGLSWLGKVPKHWEMRPAFGAYEPILERNRGMKEKTVLSLSYGRIIIKPAEKLRGLVPESFETYQIVNPGDIVLRTTDLQNDHTSLRVGMVRDRGIITSAYLALRVKAGVSADFGYQFLNVWDMSKAIYGYGSGLRQNLDFTHFKRMPVAVPPPIEQAAIVRFLDYANHRLEKAIRAKRRVIRLLNEQKQAIIHHAVTRGLDPNVPLKPSGIPWLGAIPKHWEVWPLRRCISIKSGDFAEPSRVRSECSDVHSTPVVGGNGIMGFTDRANNRGTTIVIGRVGALCGNVHLIKESAWVTDNALRITRIEGFEAGYLAEQLRVMDLNRLANANAQPLVTGGIIKSQRVVRPPMRDQQEINQRLDSLTAPISYAISRTEREIALLREYRTRLIADVVTGKLDVREAARNLPEEAEDAEVVNEEALIDDSDSAFEDIPADA